MSSAAQQRPVGGALGRSRQVWKTAQEEGHGQGGEVFGSLACYAAQTSSCQHDVAPRLLNTSSPMVLGRVQGWLGVDQVFQQKCAAPLAKAQMGKGASANQY